MIVYDLNSGHREYPGYDEIEDRRGGGRGRSRRADGTYMEYGHGFLPPYDHYGMHEKMKEMEERENELEERERRLEERERRHEMDDPDAPEGVAFIRWLAVQDYLGEKINWKDLT